jgi:uncharacterized lipoprotein YajG
MEKIHAAAKKLAVVALFCVTATLAGCSYPVTPKNVPSVRDYEALSLKDASLIVTNAEQDSTVYVLPTETGAKSALRTNRQAQSKLLVEALAGELAKRGARLSSRAPLTLSVSLPQITFIQTKELFQIKVKALISSSAGWSKNYEGIAETSKSGSESVNAMVNRLGGRALADTIKAMLGDAEFLEQLNKKSSK